MFTTNCFIWWLSHGQILDLKARKESEGKGAFWKIHGNRRVGLISVFQQERWEVRNDRIFFFAFLLLFPGYISFFCYAQDTVLSGNTKTLTYRLNFRCYFYYQLLLLLLKLFPGFYQAVVFHPFDKFIEWEV